MAWIQRLLNVFTSAGAAGDVERELRFHLEETAEKLRADGMTPGEAARAARLRFGGFVKHAERTRDMDVTLWLDAAVRNVRYAARALRRAPGFTAAVVLTLALGIGANSAVFSAIDAVLLRPLPFPDADRLMRLTQTAPASLGPFVAPQRLEDWNRMATSFRSISGYYLEDASETSGELPENLKRAWVAPRFLQVLGVAPALGRGFAPEEERFAGPSAVIISDRLWRRRFGGTPDALGKVIRAGKSSWRIVGVMPASFRFPDGDVDLWSPSPPDAPYAQSRESSWFTAIGRLTGHATQAEARADLARVQAALGHRFPKPDAQVIIDLQPLKETQIAGIRGSLWLLFGSVTLLLLLACTNVAALLLSRGQVRRQEIAVRFSLGASRIGVAAQLMTEVLLLTLAGAALGLAGAWAAIGWLRKLAKEVPRVEEIALDGRIVLYSLVCAVAAAVVCGLVPALRGTRLQTAGSLGGRWQVSGRKPLQLFLVGVQVSLAVTLLLGAALLLRSFQELSRVSPGFDPSHVLTFQISTTWAETESGADRERLRRLLETVRATPGVQAAAIAAGLPGVKNKFESAIATREHAEGDRKLVAEARFVSPGYFATLGIPLEQGEMCRQGAHTVTGVVNRSFASLLGDRSPVGNHVIVPDNKFVDPAEITGVVGDAREGGLDQPPPPTVYWCAALMQPGAFFLARTAGAPEALAQAIRHKVREVEPLRSVFDIAPLSAHISDAYAESRLRTVLLAFFAFTAVSLASVGLYGTLSYLVNIRQREIALRMSFGAMRRHVIALFVRQGLLVALIGCTAGLTLAAALHRILAGMLYGVSTTDRPTAGAVIVLVLAAAALASLIPALRAARLQPMEVLREE